MSVEDRLRDGLERSAAEFVPAGFGGVGAAVSTARRRRTGRRLAGGMAVVVLAAGVGLWVDRGSPDAAPSPVPAAPTSARPSATASPSPAETVDQQADAALASALRGEWVTDVVTTEEATAAMVRTGTADHRRVVLADVGVPGRFTLTFDELAYRMSLDGVPEDEGTWYVRDGRLGLVPTCGNCRLVLAPRAHRRRPAPGTARRHLTRLPAGAVGGVRECRLHLGAVPPPLAR